MISHRKLYMCLHVHYLHNANKSDSFGEFESLYRKGFARTVEIFQNFSCVYTSLRFQEVLIAYFFFFNKTNKMN